MGLRDRLGSRWVLTLKWVFFPRFIGTALLFTLVALYCLSQIHGFSYAGVAHAQFGIGLKQEWTDFHDPQGSFSLQVPPGWTFQPGPSDDRFFVFYGTGDADLFYVEILDSRDGLISPADYANDAIRRYSGSEGLLDFKLISPPAPGMLGDADASFTVYAYSDVTGNSVVEGRAFTVKGEKVLTVTFGDAWDRFDASTQLFNSVLQSVVLHDADRWWQDTARSQEFAVGSLPGAGFGVPFSEEHSVTGVSEQSHEGMRGYESPGGFYRFAVPDEWMLWEEQSTARGDTIDPWNGVFSWGTRPVTKTLFIWDFFDEWEQQGAQYEIVLAVIENVPGSHGDALDMLVDGVMAEHARIYTTSNARTLIGAVPGLVTDIVVRPGMTEPWTVVSDWYKSVAFYSFKRGTTLFLWILPKEVAGHPTIIEAMQGFQWNGQ